MLFWILACLTLYLVYIYVPATMFLPREGVSAHVAARDALPEPGVMTARARRAQANMQENLPIFLTLAILSMVVDGADQAQAILGAQLFVLARAAYLPLYLISIPYTRSIAYTVGLIGCLVMALALI